MAIRQIRTEGDPVLRKECRPVREMNERMQTLIGDMFDTMYDADGVGLAAPQVGILRQIFVVDVSAEVEGTQPYVFINPEIVETAGEQTGSEGCLSVPGYQGEVTRAEHVKIRALDADMKEFVLEADGLLARCIQHENDHLHGQLYVDKVNGELVNVEEAAQAAEGADEE